MTPLWTADAAAHATGGTAAGAWQAGRVAIDSRGVQPGDLFIAIRGERMDGHQFVADALARGAVAAVVSQTPEGADVEKLLLVADTQQALEALGRFNRARSKARIIGLTGSVGKTSAKEMLRTALIPHGETFASHGNFNNHIGTPLNLANLPQSARFAVFEMGMNHAGEIAALTRQVRPEVALITTVEAVHLEFFRTLEAIAAAKCEIFEGMGQAGTALLNADNAQFAICNAAAARAGVGRILRFGRAQESDCRLSDYLATLDGSRVRAVISGQEIAYTLRTVGAHWAAISVAVLGVAHALGLDVEKTARALADFSELAGRGSLHRIPAAGGFATLVDDSYNASPAAMRAAFLKLAELKRAGAGAGRIIAALGDMRELGETGPALHAALAADIEAAGIDMVFTAGPLMKHLHDALPARLRASHAESAAALTPLLQAVLKPGDVLLVKGSHGSHMYETAAALLAAKEEQRHAV